MKKVDYEHFSRFLMPHSPAARGEELYFCVKRADMEENRYFSDLWLWKGGAAKRLTSSGDVNGFWLTEAGVVFSALREKRDKERAEALVAELAPDPGEQSAALLERRYAFAPEDEKGKKRAVSALQRLGYPWEEIRRALAHYAPDTGYEDD